MKFYIIKELLNNINEKNINKLIDTFKIIDLEKIQIPFNKIFEMKNDSNFKLIDTLILYFLNNNELNDSIQNNIKFNVNLIDEIEQVINKILIFLFFNLKYFILNFFYLK